MSSPALRILLGFLVATVTVTAIQEADAAPRRARRAATQAAHPAPAPAPVSKSAQLNRLYQDYWEASLKLNPVQATLQGDLRYSDQLPNYLSAEYRRQAHDFTTEWLRKVEAIGPEGLEGQDLLSYQIFIDDAHDALASEQFPDWMMPLNHFNNVAVVVAILGSGTNAQPFATVKDYENWQGRAAQIPVVFEQAIANMREGMAAGVVQPRPLTEKVLLQLDTLIKPQAEETLFWLPIQKMPENFSDADRERLTTGYKRMIEGQTMPAYRRLRDFLNNEYLPGSRTTAGLGELPNGAAWYAQAVKENTTLPMTPDQIHQAGIDNIARLHTQIQRIMRETRFRGPITRFFRFMQTDPRFQYESDDIMLSNYRGVRNNTLPRIPALFSLTPKAQLDIRPAEPSRAQNAANAFYARPAEDNSQPGILYVNTTRVAKARNWETEALFLHEAVPGHHFQLALQQELTDLPKFRRFGGEIAYTEGWALYAESLGKELGLYQSPYSYYGRLQSELWRSIQQVVDTGLHSKGWTREQAVAFITDNSAMDAADAAGEVERMMAIPGQALAYRTGEMKFTELRAKAQRELGDRFDIREFHAELLKNGSMPLDILERQIDQWIGKKRGAPTAAAAPASAPATTPASTPAPAPASVTESTPASDPVRQ
jgi:uncharacterized protein (DUF885 family)